MYMLFQSMYWLLLSTGGELHIEVRSELQSLVKFYRGLF